MTKKWPLHVYFILLPSISVWAAFGIYKAIAVTIESRVRIVSVCGNDVVEGAEQCDNSTDPGTYSTSISGRNCTAFCTWAAYCGDGVVQTIFSEQCDDGNNASNDFCRLDCQAETVPPGNGLPGNVTPTPYPGGSSGGPFNPGSNMNIPDTHVSITGKAYPHADVNILRDGKAIGIVRANAAADFLFTISGVTPGTSTFGFWAQDEKGLRSIAFNTTLQVAQGAVTVISGVFIPPTIEVDKKQVGEGEIINFSGSSVPDSKITTVVNSAKEIRTNAVADAKGSWIQAFDTKPLEQGAHSVKAFFTTPMYDYDAKSELSQTIAFFVGTGDPEKPRPGSGIGDINNDSKVNLIDFSIMLFNWGEAKGAASPSDFNGDNIVNITDFSILLFNWTG